MQDSKYCYPNSEVLKNKLNITDKNELFEAEKELTAIRLKELQDNPIKGKFDFKHLKAIHKYIFQDIYDSIYQAKISEMDAKKKMSECNHKKRKTRAAR